MTVSYNQNSQEGVALYGYTLKVPPLKVPYKWFTGLDGANIAATYSLHQTQRKILEYTPSTENLESPSSSRKLLEVSDKQDIFSGFEGWLTEEGIESLEVRAICTKY
jgi:hypothetical protein